MWADLIVAVAEVSALPSMTPSASIASASAVNGLPEQALFAYHLMNTSPVGRPAPPETVAFAWTFWPIRTDDTTVWPALWISRTRLGVAFVTVSATQLDVEFVKPFVP